MPTKSSPIKTMIERGGENNSPPVEPPSSSSVGEERHNQDDDGSSCSSVHSAGSIASSLLSSLSGKYRTFDRSTNSHSSGSSYPPIDCVHSPSRKIGASDEYEDDKASMMAQLMKNHAEAVTISLVERSSLVKSIIRLSRHVPGCVISSLLDDINRDRKDVKERADRRRRKVYTQNNNNMPWRSRRRTTDSCDTFEEDQVYDSEQLYSKGHTQHLNNFFSRSRRRTTDSCDTFGEDQMYDGEQLSSTDRLFNQRSIAQLLGKSTKPLPLFRRGQSALLFIDISGFTNLSTMLDVDSFSNCINTYFQKVIDQVASYGGDILKFAGDAIFCEWRESSHESCQTLEQCVLQAASCAIDIVALCSDYNLIGNAGISRRRSSFLPSSRSSFRSSTRSSYSDQDSLTKAFNDAEPQSPRHGTDMREASFKRRVSVQAPFNRRPSVESTLNVRCGLGVGHMAGVHVGDNISRREFLILGDPIDQVAAAEAAARHGEVFASPETISVLAKIGTIEGDWESNVNDRRPTLLAVRKERLFAPRGEFTPCRDVGLPCGGENLLQQFDDLDSSELHWLRRMISLYVHPVVVSEESERSSQHDMDFDRNGATAELRNVFTCFISPKFDYSLTGDEESDQKLFNRLNDIMTITMRHLDRAQGHLRQFIVDDKGIVLIFTFGLRGSTFPNMIAQRAIPLTFSICQSLRDELGIKVAAGATFEQAYCGVVGGVNRHEFSVLGPAVNLAARLMSPKHNSDVILVDKNVRLLTGQIFFRPLPAVKAKGYKDPVPIFQAMRISTDKQANKWGHAKKKFVGRTNEIKQIMHVAKDMTLTRISSKFLFVSAASGTGKSTLMVQATECVRAMVKKMKKRVIVTRYISNEGDSRVPFSLFRSIFKDLLRQIKQDDEGSYNSSRGGSQSSSVRESSSKQPFVKGPVDFEIDKEWDSLSLQSHSTKSSIMSTDATRFRFICEELNAPPEFIEVVGKRFLGLKSAAGPSTGSNPPDLDKIVNFMADAFLRCTNHADLVLLALDDVHWMDEMSWKVVQAIFERSGNVLTFCGSRPPSTNLLAVDDKFWSKLHGAYTEEGRYMEIILGPFHENDVKDMISCHLGIRVDEIDSTFWRNVFTTSGGMPHYLSYVLETIKRNDLTVKLGNGLIGLKSSENEESKLGFKSVNDLLLYRLDALDASVRATLHLAAVLGTEFDLLDAALSYEEMFDIIDSDRFQVAMEICAHFDVAEKEGILEQVSFSSGDEDEFGDPVDEEDQLCAGLEDVVISSAGRKSHPLYSDNRRYRFTHDSWKTSILSVMLDSRKEELHEQIATVLEREISQDTQSEGDLEMQIRVFKHWNLSGNFPKAADLALKIGGELMILGLNSQAELLFSDVILGLENDQGGITYGGISCSVLDAVEPAELELLIKVYIAKGKALCSLAKGKAGAEAYQSALDVS